MLLSSLALRLVEFALGPECADTLSDSIPDADSEEITSLTDLEEMCLRGWIDYWLAQTRLRTNDSDVATSARLIRLSTSVPPPVSASGLTATHERMTLLEVWERFWTEVGPTATSLIIDSTWVLRSALTGCPSPREAGETFSMGRSGVLLSQLTQLSLAGCTLTDQLVHSVATLCALQLPLLRDLVLDRCGLTSTQLKTVLTALALHRSHQTDTDSGALAALRSLSLRSNRLCVGALSSIVSALYDDASVCTLNLSENPLIFTQAARAPWCARASMTIKEDAAPCAPAPLVAALILAIRESPLVHGGGEAAAHGTRTSFVNLSLRGCAVAPTLLAGLHRPLTAAVALPLRTLDLSFTPLGDDGVLRLASLIRSAATPCTAFSDSTNLAACIDSHAPLLVHLASLSLRCVCCGPDSLHAWAILLTHREATCQPVGGPSSVQRSRAQRLLPALRHLDFSQNTLSGAQGAAATAALCTAMMTRCICHGACIDTKKPCRDTAENPASDLTYGVRLEVESCHVSDLLVEAMRHSDIPPSLPTEVPPACACCLQFGLYIGRNRLTRGAVRHLRERLLSYLGVHARVDIFIEGNPIPESGPGFLAAHSVCADGFADLMPEQTPALAPVSVAHRLNDGALDDTMTEGGDYRDSTAGNGKRSRRASTRTRPALALRHTGAMPETSRSPSLRPLSPLNPSRMWSRHASWRASAGSVSAPPDHRALVSDPTMLTSPPRAIKPVRSRDDGAAVQSPRPFIDVDELAQLMEETDAIMRDRVDVMLHELVPDSHEPIS